MRDAHNHVHLPALAAIRGDLNAALAEIGLEKMVVNGSCENEWAAVAALAAADPRVVPSYGVHPWKVDDVTPQWREQLAARLDVGGHVGEIGLDRMMTRLNLPAQQEIFRWQLAEAARRDVVATIHCLRAWEPMRAAVRESALPRRGFLLHAFNGPADWVAELAERGAYFSFSGAFLAPRREQIRSTFARIPTNRLLVETDAPAMPLPAERERFSLPIGVDGKRQNHPANLVVAYDGLAETTGVPPADLVARVRDNFDRLFGGS